MRSDETQTKNRLNVGLRLCVEAAASGDQTAIAEPFKRFGRTKRNAAGDAVYRSISFAELAARKERVAANLVAAGLKPGMKLVLMVRPGIDFVTLVYALFQAGAVVVMIDPGMGLAKMIDCLASVKPDGFVAIPPVHALRIWHRKKFPAARFNVTVGRRFFWGGPTLAQLERDTNAERFVADTTAESDAAIMFTSGSTGPAKGVLYSHGIIAAQADEIAARFDIKPGGVDLAGFPFFGLYDAAHGTTMIVPDMDTTRPASVNPKTYIETAKRFGATQSFASPALWNKVVRYAAANALCMPSLTRAISSGAPFPVKLLSDFLSVIAPDGDIFTPYGATESLPVAEIGAREILGETAEKTKLGRGVCVGKKFDQIRWRLIPITDEPFETLEKIPPLETGQIGELIVTGPQVTRRYVTRTEANALSKITDSAGNIWHRIGDVGLIDERDRFWFCGRKAHRVETFEHGTLFSVPCESIFNQHPAVERSALASFPDTKHKGFRLPVIFIELKNGRLPVNTPDDERLIEEITALGKASPVTSAIDTIRFLETFPVDIRHNAKINRELLCEWAEQAQAGRIEERW